MKIKVKGKKAPEQKKVETKATRLSPPWYGYYRKVLNLFQGDPEITISDLEETDEAVYSFTIASDNREKLEAIEKLIGRVQVIGNIKVVINYSAADQPVENWGEVIETAFKGNPLFKEMVVEKDPVMHVSFYYAVFNRDIVSFWDDNLADYCGNEHYIAAELAKDLINASTNVGFCTASEEEN